MRKVRVTCEGPSPVTTKVVDAETGEAIHGIAAVDLRIRPNEPVTVDLSLHAVAADVAAEGKFWLDDITTGRRRLVKAVEFADGERVEF